MALGRQYVRTTPNSLCVKSAKKTEEDTTKYENCFGDPLNPLKRLALEEGKLRMGLKSFDPLFDITISSLDLLVEAKIPFNISIKEHIR